MKLNKLHFSQPYKKTFLALAAIITITLFSCTKDVQPPVLKQIQRVAISGVDSVYLMTAGDSLNIAPSYNIAGMTGSPADTSLYNINWVAFLSNGTIDTFKTGSLHTIAPLGTSNWYCRITNKQTGVFNQVEFSVNGTSPTDEGWFVLSDVGNDSSRLGMISYSQKDKGYSVTTDVLAAMLSNFSVAGKPVLTAYTIPLINDFGADGGLFVATDKSAAVLNGSSLNLTNNNDRVADLLNVSSASFNPGALLSVATGYWTGLVNYNHNLYYFDFGDFNPTFAGPMPKSESTSQLLYASKFMATPDAYGVYYGSAMSGNCIVFDEHDQRFEAILELLYDYGGSTLPTPLSGGTLFDFNIRKKLLYLTWSNYNGEYYGIVQDNDNSASYLLAFDDYSFSQTLYKQLPISVDSTMRFLISPQYGNIIYAAGSKLYKYDPNDESNILLEDFGNRQITWIGVPSLTDYNFDSRYDDLTKKIVVATYDPGNINSSGEVNVYTESSEHGMLSLEGNYKGFGKIISVTYKIKPQI